MRLFYFIILLLGCYACIDPFEYTIGNDKSLVVEGSISEIDTASVSVRYSDQIYNSALVLPIPDAKVSVFENQSTEITFSYNEPTKLYLSNNKAFRAKVGHTYQLKIVLSSGQTYLSELDTLRPAEPITAISDKFHPEKSAFTVTAELTPKSETNNYYLFNFINYKKPNYCASCQSNQFYDREDNNDCSSPFKNCIAQPGPTSQTSYGFACNGTIKCWNYKKIRDFLVFSDEVLAKGTSRTIQLFDVPLSTFERYFLEIHLNRISKKAYQYFRLLEQSGKKTGTLFDPTPPLLVGNVYNQNNLNDRALGYFLVMGQKISGYNVERSNATNGMLVPPDPEKEFKEVVSSVAPTMGRCFFPPISLRCTITDFRTDQQPKDWKNF